MTQTDRVRYPAETVPPAGDYVYRHSSQRLFFVRATITMCRALLELIQLLICSATAVALFVNPKLMLSFSFRQLHSHIKRANYHSSKGRRVTDSAGSVLILGFSEEVHVEVL